MKRGELVGTHAAHTRCVTCGHSRLRHGWKGTGRCTMYLVVPADPPNGLPLAGPNLCPCDQFVPPKEVTQWPVRAIRGTTSLW